MILAPAELAALTGFTRASAQQRWLRRHGWRFEVNALGRPIVAVAEFNQHMVSGKKGPSTQEPNFEGINSVAKKTVRAKPAVRANGYEIDLSYDKDGNAIDLGR